MMMKNYKSWVVLVLNWIGSFYNLGVLVYLKIKTRVRNYDEEL